MWVGGRKSKAFAYTKLHHPPKAHRFLPGENVESRHFCVKYLGGEGATNPLLPPSLIPVLFLLGQEQLQYSITLRVNKLLGFSVFSNSGVKRYPAPHPLPEKPLHYLWLKVQPRPEHTRRDIGCGKTGTEMGERRKLEAGQGNS